MSSDYINALQLLLSPENGQRVWSVGGQESLTWVDLSERQDPQADWCSVRLTIPSPRSIPKAMGMSVTEMSTDISSNQDMKEIA